MRARLLRFALVLLAARMAWTPAIAQAPPSPGPSPRPKEEGTPSRGPEAARDPRRAEMEFRSLLSGGAKALEVEDFASAEDLLGKAVSLRPGSGPAHYQLGRALAGLKRLKPATVEFQAALKIEPGHAGAIMGLAAIDEGTGDFAAAERHYREVIAVSPNPRAQRALASLLGREGRTGEAEKILTGLLALHSEDADSRFELALARAIKGDCAAAIPDFRKVLEAQPGRVTALFQLGNCLSRTGQAAEAEATLAKFRETSESERLRKETEKRVHFTLLEADGLMEAGKVEPAIAKAREALAIDGNSGSAHAFLGSILTEAGRNDEALVELKRAAEIDPGDILSLSEAGRILAMGGRFEEALSWFQRAAAADANAAEPHRFLALLYQQMGRREEAEREKAIYLRLSRAP